MTAGVFIGLGSNIGDRFGKLQQALDEIAGLQSTGVKNVSSVYETSPVGDPDQPDFLNAVAELSTGLGPAELFASLKSVERLVGRTPSRRWGPREIDIDILLYGDRIVDSEGLTIPHPRMTLRRFVLVPLTEISPETIHPVLGDTVAVIAGRCTSQERIEKCTEQLRIP